jgi:hypothetical protein
LWFFGPPQLDPIFPPAQGLVSTLIQTFSGRPVVGYIALVVALAGTAFMAFGLAGRSLRRGSAKRNGAGNAAGRRRLRETTEAAA